MHIQFEWDADFSFERRDNGCYVRALVEISGERERWLSARGQWREDVDLWIDHVEVEQITNEGYNWSRAQRPDWFRWADRIVRDLLETDEEEQRALKERLFPTY
jgi:hypothetical protein